MTTYSIAISTESASHEFNNINREQYELNDAAFLIAQYLNNEDTIDVKVYRDDNDKLALTYGRGDALNGELKLLTTVKTLRAMFAK